ncbi:MAG: hypothetical protein ACF8Q5_05635 [Phycisphaerales bacterium JB040]
MTRTSVLAVMAVSAVVGGCTGTRSRPDAPVEPLTGRWEDPGPFEATRMRVFPLTRLDEAADGTAQIVLFLEMQDHWGDSVKAVGDLTVRVWPSRSIGAGSDPEVWEVSLWGSENNASYYDPTSRTYRVPLTDLPAWITSSEGPNRDASIVVEAVLRTPASEGGQRSLRDQYTFSKGG